MIFLLSYLMLSMAIVIVISFRTIVRMDREVESLRIRLDIEQARAAFARRELPGNDAAPFSRN